ncbi:ABC transporter ATP-binding protein [bacterium]|nr:ABC transporter ATP-binding protein [Candidatus Elulimicrobium humile]
MQNLKVYNFLERLFGMVGNIKIHPVDFNLPWYSIYKKYWLRLAVSLIAETIVWVFFTTLPLIINYAIKTQNITLVISLGIVFMMLSIIVQTHMRNYALAEIGIMRSISNSAYKFFVKVDPVHHSTRESGKVISKINRAVGAYENTTDILTFNLLRFIIQISVILVSFIYYDFTVGIIAGGSLIIMLTISTIGQVFVAKKVIPKDNDQGDIQQQLEVESLQQVALIRSSFATPEHIKKIRKTNIRTGEVQATVGMSFISTAFIPRILYGIFFMSIASFIINLVKIGNLDVITAIALITMYMSAYDIIFAGRHIERIISDIERIKNLYTYIREYGDSSYPV